MTTPDVLCGYPLGRYAPSSTSFVTSYLSDEDENAHCASGRLLIVESGRGPWGADGLVPETLIDVGRTKDGHLVFIESHSRILPNHERATDIPPFSLVLEDLPHLDNDARYMVHAPQQAEASQSWLKKLALSHSMISVLSRQATAKKLMEWLKTHRGRRLAGFFVLIVVVIIVGVTLASSASSSSASSSSASSAPAPTDNFSTPEPGRGAVEQDAVEFALASVQAGDVASLVVNPQLGDFVRGRIVRQMGEVVLVEVTVTGRAKTAIATLLLQKSEAGWRTRDVFDVVN